MKKIIALVVALIAFGLNANAQQKKATTAKTAVTKELSKEEKTEQAAKKDLAALTGVVKTLTETQKTDFYNFFVTKHKMFMEEMTSEQRETLYQTMEGKIKASLSPGDIAKLEKNPAVMKQLTH